MKMKTQWWKLSAVMLGLVVISNCPGALAQDDPYKKSEPPVRQTSADQQTIEKKLDTIIFPKLEFQDAKLGDVLEFLCTQAKAFDQKTGGDGVNIILNLAKGEQPTITLNLRSVPLRDVLRYVTEISGLKFRVDPKAVVIYSPGAPVQDATGKKSEPPVRQTSADQQIIEKKLDTIIIPILDFKDAKLGDVVEFLCAQAKAIDQKTGGKGVNFILHGKVEQPLVTLNLRSVPLRDVLRYVTEITGLKFRVDPEAVVIYQEPVKP